MRLPFGVKSCLSLMFSIAAFAGCTSPELSDQSGSPDDGAPALPRLISPDPIEVIHWPEKIGMNPNERKDFSVEIRNASQLPIHSNDFERAPLSHFFVYDSISPTTIDPGQRGFAHFYVKAIPPQDDFIGDISLISVKDQQRWMSKPTTVKFPAADTTLQLHNQCDFGLTYKGSETIEREMQFFIESKSELDIDHLQIQNENPTIRFNLNTDSIVVKFENNKHLLNGDLTVFLTPRELEYGAFSSQIFVSYGNAKIDVNITAEITDEWSLNGSQELTILSMPSQMLPKLITLYRMSNVKFKIKSVSFEQDELVAAYVVGDNQIGFRRKDGITFPEQSLMILNIEINDEKSEANETRSFPVTFNFRG